VHLFTMTLSSPRMDCRHMSFSVKYEIFWLSVKRFFRVFSLLEKIKKDISINVLPSPKIRLKIFVVERGCFKLLSVSVLHSED
jgi:hypothetical protein